MCVQISVFLDKYISARMYFCMFVCRCVSRSMCICVYLEMAVFVVRRAIFPRDVVTGC